MSMFKGMLNNSNKDYHSFFVKDKVLEDLGLSYYTQNSLSKFLIDNKKTFEKYFSYENTLDSLLGDGNFNEEPSIMLYNLEENFFELSVKDFLLGKSLHEVINLNDDIQSGKNKDPSEDDLKLIHSIQNSLSGCITFRPSVKIFGKNYSPLVQLFLKNKEDNYNDRVITNLGAPVLTDVPRRPTGRKYSWHNTEKILAEQNTNSDKIPNIGIFSSPAENGNNNPVNTITGSMRTSYNQGLGLWESGTQQILARLLTDIDAAPIITNIDWDGLDAFTPKDFYDPESVANTSQFRTGIALPMTVHRGNPNTFGPNILKGKDELKHERLRVVNRAPRSFKKGDVVLLSLIDNEWIVQGFDAGTIEKRTGIKIGKWSFSKFVANSDSFFRDNRYDGSNYNTLINYDVYETRSRLKFYVSLYTSNGGAIGSNLTSMNNILNVAKLNLHTPLEKDSENKYAFDEEDEKAALAKTLPPLADYDFEINSKYNQVSIFDQTGIHMGGTNIKNYFGRTNVFYNEDLSSISELDFYDKLPFFWGPVFSKGYSAQQVQRLKSSGTAVLNDPSNNGKFMSNIDNQFVLSSGSDYNALSSEAFAYPNNDPNLLHMPAEIATNGSVSGQYSYPIEWIDSYNPTSTNMFEFSAGYLRSKNRYHYLIRPSDSGNFYGLAPVQSNEIQLLPLTLDLVAHAKYSGSEQANLDKVKNYVGTYFKFTTDDEGNVSSESKEVLLNLPNREGTFPSIGSDTVTDATNEYYPQGVFTGDQRSNFVGIIAAKNKFSAFGSLTINVGQNIGVVAKRTVSGASGGGISIIPIGGGLVIQDPSNPSLNRSEAQWGGRTDNPETFGTTALHLRIFDQWPDEQTIYDGRYFAVLHFNPILLSSGVQPYFVDSEVVDKGESIKDWEKPETVSILSGYKYERRVDKISTSVDFRVPTFGHPSNKSIDNVLVPLNAIVDYRGCNNNPLRPVGEWRVNPIRRGQLLTRGGFRYYKRSIGLNPNSFYIIERGTNFSPNQIIELAKNVKLKILSVNGTGGVVSFELISKGDSFLPSDFNQTITLPSEGEEKTTIKGYRLAVNNSEGDNAIIAFGTGIVWDKLFYDLGPEERIGGARLLTSKSNSGATDAVEGDQITTLELDGDGKYDGFYFFHNDVHYTLGPNIATFVPGFIQYVNINVSSG